MVVYVPCSKLTSKDVFLSSSGASRGYILSGDTIRILGILVVAYFHNYFNIFSLQGATAGKTTEPDGGTINATYRY